MKLFKVITVLMFIACKSAMGSQFFAPGVAPLVPQSFIPSSGVLPSSVIATPFAPVPALGPQYPGVVTRAAVPVAPAVAAAVPSPLLPFPFGLEARSIHAVAPAAVPTIPQAPILLAR